MDAPQEVDGIRLAIPNVITFKGDDGTRYKFTLNRTVKLGPDARIFERINYYDHAVAQVLHLISNLTVYPMPDKPELYIEKTGWAVEGRIG